MSEWLKGARLESEACDGHVTPKRVNAQAISDLTFPNYHAMCVIDRLHLAYALAPGSRVGMRRRGGGRGV